MNRLRLVMTLSTLSLAAGCATKQPIDAWQSRVTRFIAEQGNGDPNCLRDMVLARSRDSVRPERIMIGEFGVSGPPQNGAVALYDVQGVVIGHQRIADRYWYLFLVGVLRQQTSGPPGIEDVRLAAMTATGKELLWAVSEPNAHVTQRYINPGGTAPAGRAMDDPEFRVFPKESDAYRVLVEGDNVQVFEDRSGSFWTLRLGSIRP